MQNSFPKNFSQHLLTYLSVSNRYHYFFQLTNELKRIIDNERADISRKTQDGLELFINKQITLIATNITEFTRLKSKIRVNASRFK